MNEQSRRSIYSWDYDISEEEFFEILNGSRSIGSLTRDWAAIRLLDSAPYAEIIRLLGFRALAEGWPRWRSGLRSDARRRGIDFLLSWLPERHPELFS